MNGQAQEIAELDRMVHEPARLSILTILDGVGEADFLYLQREGGFTQGNLSSHLTRLEEAGYVEIRKTFKGKLPLTLCSLTTKGERALADYSRRMLAILQASAAGARKRARR
jgi:DNA-binding MarR family transcriptional regulator